jgi:putative Holliday junction resolvase
MADDEFAPILGLDYGHKRIGVAISDALRLTAQPLQMVPVVDRDEAAAAAAVAGLARERGATTIVIGLPMHMSGEEGESAAAARAFGDRLADLGLAPAYWDERLTSAMAERALRDRLGGGGKKRRKREKAGAVDIVAAQIVLQGYLDSLRRPVADDDDDEPRDD